jgi:hypothetical protein
MNPPGYLQTAYNMPAGMRIPDPGKLSVRRDGKLKLIPWHETEINAGMADFDCILLV